jgi:hypothetical protein
MIVLLSTWLYSTDDSPRGVRNPAIKINGHAEKSLVIPPADCKDMSIQIPKTPLKSEQTALSTSRPGSPSQKKRKSEKGYFMKVHD